MKWTEVQGWGDLFYLACLHLLSHPITTSKGLGGSLMQGLGQIIVGSPHSVDSLDLAKRVLIQAVNLVLEREI